MTKEMAMRIGKQSVVNNVSRKNWEDFCDIVGFSFRNLHALLNQLASEAIAVSSQIEDKSIDYDSSGEKRFIGGAWKLKTC